MRQANWLICLATVLVACGASPDAQWKSFQHDPDAHENTAIKWRVIYDDAGPNGLAHTMSLTYLEAEPGQYGVSLAPAEGSANDHGPLANSKRPVHIDGWAGLRDGTHVGDGKYRDSQAAWQGVGHLSRGDYLEVTGRFAEVDAYGAPMIVPSRIVRLSATAG